MNADDPTDDKAERARAELARGLREFAERMSTPAYLDFVEAQGKLARMRYDALMRNGFTESQALDLCWRSIGI